METIEIPTGDEPASSIIVLHGLGADGNDFAPVCEMLDLAAVGAVRFVLPHAPMRPVTLNNGYRMRAWYDIVELGGSSREDEEGLRASQALVESLLAREKARGVAASRIVVAGFSQGCAVALMTGLRHAERLAGLVGLSGYLPLAAATATERSDANRDLPIFIGHGRGDDVVPLSRGTAARDALVALGYPVEWHDYPMAHSVSPTEVADLNRWLLRVLARAGSRS
jgi:phospholipase/carboxylesterase